MDVRVALEGVAGLADVVVQQLQLAGDEAGVGGVAAPGDDVDGIEAAVDGGAHGGELGDDERGRGGGRRDGEVVRLGAARGRQTGDAQLDVLRARVSSGQRQTARGETRTPLTMRVPTRVTRPLRLSERTDDSTSVEPFSDGASRAAHSSSPALSACSVSVSCSSNHPSSRCCDDAWARASWSAAMGGHGGRHEDCVCTVQGLECCGR